MNICVIGVGYVGLTTSIGLASLGNSVYAIDQDFEKISELRQGKLPIYEPGMTEIFRDNLKNGRLIFSNSLAEGIRNATIVYIAVGTPPKEDGSVNLNQVDQVAEEIGKYLDEYKLIVVKSTVPVGTGRRIIRTIAAHQAETTFDLVSNPEFLREGSALEDFFHPDRIVIGGDYLSAIGLLESLYQKLDAPIVTTTLETAEMIKYAANAFLATKISFINEIANLCQKLKVEIVDVAKGIGLDPRIGLNFLNAGIGFGGSCLPKDVAALLEMGINSKTSMYLLNAVIKVNHKQVEDFVKRVLARLSSLSDQEGIQIGIWGLAFKPNTDDLREAPALKVIERLLKAGYQIKAYDPVAMEKANKILPEIIMTKNPYQAAEEADVILILTEWAEFSNLDWGYIKNLMRQNIIFDGRNLLNPQEILEHGFEYYSIGRITK